jgi:hypothetical protein
MGAKLTDLAGPGGADSQAGSAFRRAWHSIRDRALGGLMLVFPILITLRAVYCLYTT